MFLSCHSCSVGCMMSAPCQQQVLHWWIKHLWVKWFVCVVLTKDPRFVKHRRTVVTTAPTSDAHCFVFYKSYYVIIAL